MGTDSTGEIINLADIRPLDVATRLDMAERRTMRLLGFRAIVADWSLPVYGTAKKNLDAAGIKTFGDIDRVGFDAVRAVRGVGPVTIEVIVLNREWYVDWLSMLYATVAEAEEAMRGARARVGAES